MNFFSIVRSSYEKSTEVGNFQFMLQQENPQYDLDAYPYNPKARALVVAKDPLSNSDNLKVQINPQNWETYVFLSKWNFNQSSADEVQKQYPNLKFDENCDAEPKHVFCLKGTMTKEQVVQVRDYLEEKNWVKLDLANPEVSNNVG